MTGADGTVSTVDPGDGQVTPLDGVTGAQQVTPSPDGSTLVFTQLDDDDTPVIAIARDGDITRIPVPTPPYFHLVSPDGMQVASLGDAPDGGGVSLLVTDLATATTREVDRGRPYFLSWRPDGTRLAANVDSSVLTTLDPDGTRTPLALAPGAFQAPVWTAEDELVVVLAPPGAQAVPISTGLAAQAVDGSLAVVDPVDESTTMLAPVSGGVSFDVGADRVAWVAGDSTQVDSLGPLEVIGLDGTGRTVISDADVAMFEWSPDGQHLLFHVIEPEGGLAPHVWDGTNVTAYEAFLPTATMVTQYLPFWPQYAVAITQWSPDGAAFAVATADPASGSGTVVVQALDGRRNALTAGAMVVWVP